MESQFSPVESAHIPGELISPADESGAPIQDFPVTSASSTAAQMQRQQQMLLGLAPGPAPSNVSNVVKASAPSSSSALNPKEIAQWLIGRDYLLTALELYTELCEDGHEIRELRDFFANHKNFDVGRYCPPAHTATLSSSSAAASDRQLAVNQQPRPSRHAREYSDVTNNDTEMSSSIDDSGSPPHFHQCFNQQQNHQTHHHQTVHSRISASEQGDQLREKDEHIAVLEYELRQAKDAAEKLKTRLHHLITHKDAAELRPHEGGLEFDHSGYSKSAKCPTNHLEASQLMKSGVFQSFQQPSTSNNIGGKPTVTMIQTTTVPSASTPQETRTINYLVHEYLQSHGFKMTALTFCDENEDQDLDDWEDVLGVSKDVAPPPPGLTTVYKQWKTALALHSSLMMSSAANTTGLQSSVAPPTELQPGSPAPDQQTHTVTSNQSMRMSFLSSNNETCLTSNVVANAGDVKTPDMPHMSSTAASRMDSITDVSSPLPSFIGQPKHLTSSGNQAQNSFAKIAGHEPVSQQNSSSHIRMHSGQHRAKAVAVSISAATPITPIIQEMPVHKLIKTLHLANTKSERSKTDLLKSSQQASLIQTVGLTLPKIIPNVLLNRREELVPLVLASIRLHPDVVTRGALINQLFHLMKKPDVRQRQLLVDGVLQLLDTMSPNQLHVGEIITECIELAGSKFQEKRLLALDLFGHLSPFYDNDRSSIAVLGLLCKLQADLVPIVRLTVFKTLALQLNYINFTLSLNEFPEAREEISQNQEVHHYLGTESTTPNVYGIVRALIICGLRDSNPEIARVVRELLVPVFLDVLRNSKPCADNLQSFLVHLLDQTTQLVDSKTTLTQPALDPMNIFPENVTAEIIVSLQLLQSSFQHVSLDILFSSPFFDEDMDVNEIKNDETPGFENAETVKRLWSAVNDWMSVYFLDGNSSQSKESISEPWPEINWVVTVLVPKLGQLMRTVDPINQSVTAELGKAVRSLCILFGRQFTSAVLGPVFDILSAETIEDPKDLAHRLRLIPYSLYSIMPSLEHSTQNICLFLQAMYMSMCMQRYNWSPHPDLDVLRGALQLLLTDFAKKYADPVLNVILDFAKNEDSRARLNVSLFLSVVCPFISSSTILKKVLPALLTLANDETRLVRISTVQSFGFLLEKFSQSAELMEKLEVQFSAFVDDPQPQIKQELFDVYSSLIPNMDEKFRDNFVFPSLVRWVTIDLRGKQPASMSDAQLRVDMIASSLHIYQAASLLLLSDNIINQYIVNNLQVIKKELNVIHQSITADGSAPATDAIEAARTHVDQLIIKFSPLSMEKEDTKSRYRKERPLTVRKQKDISSGECNVSTVNTNPPVATVLSAAPTSASKFSISKFFQKFHDRSSSQSSNITVIAPQTPAVSLPPASLKVSEETELKDGTREKSLSPRLLPTAPVTTADPAPLQISLPSAEKPSSIHENNKTEQVNPVIVDLIIAQQEVLAPMDDVSHAQVLENNATATELTISSDPDKEEELEPIPEFGSERGMERFGSNATLSFDLKRAIKSAATTVDNHLAVAPIIASHSDGQNITTVNDANFIVSSSNEPVTTQKASPKANPLMETKNFFDFDDEADQPTNNSILSPVLQSLQESKAVNASIDFIIDTVYPPKEEQAIVNPPEAPKEPSTNS